MEKKEIKKKYKYLLIFYIITICLFFINSTFSKFISKTNGNMSVDVAKFSFVLKNGDKVFEDDFTYDLASNITGGNELSKKGIVPGKSGVINLTIDLTGTQTAVKYSIYINPKQTIPANLKFYSDSEYQNELSLGGTAIITEINNLSDLKIINKSIYWKWDFDVDVVENNYENTELLLSIKVLAAQYSGGE